jgi:hypothetical protein
MRNRCQRARRPWPSRERPRPSQIGRIVQIRTRRGAFRGQAALVLLFEALVIAILGLVPGQSPTILAMELLCLGGAVWLGATAVFTVRRPAIDQRQPIVANAVAAQLATLPVTARPARPSHGVVRRAERRASTMAMGTPMLQPACPATKDSRSETLMPSAGT